MGHRVHEVTEVDSDEAVYRVDPGANGERRGNRARCVGACPAAVCGKPLEPHTEHELEHKPEPKNRDHPNDRAKHANGEIDGLVPIRAPEDSERDPNEGRDGHPPMAISNVAGKRVEIWVHTDWPRYVSPMERPKLPVKMFPR